MADPTLNVIELELDSLPTLNVVEIESQGAFAFNVAEADTTAPVWTGASGVSLVTVGTLLDAGSLRVAWNPATDADSSPVRYKIYVRPSSAPTFADDTYLLGVFDGTSCDIWTEADGITDLVAGTTYHVVVRAVDTAGNETTNTNALTGIPIARNAVPDTTVPAWTSDIGIVSLTALTGLDAGSLRAVWGVATDAGSPPVRYKLFVRDGSAPSVADDTYLLGIFDGTTADIWTEKDGTTDLDSTKTYYVIVRALDTAGNETSNTNSSSAAPNARNPVSDATPPVWDTTTGIQSLVAGTGEFSGSLLAGWGSATDAGGGTVRYDVYLRAAAAPDSFGLSSPYFLRAVDGTSERIWQDANGASLSTSAAYYVVVRASDGTNEDTNTTTLSATSAARNIPKEIVKAILADIPHVKVTVADDPSIKISVQNP